MSNKRKRAPAASVLFEKVIKDAMEKDLSEEEHMAMGVATRDYLTTELGGAEFLYKLLMKAISSTRCAETKKLRALHIMGYVFLKSKDFRTIVSCELRSIIRMCCAGGESNAAAINSNPLAVKLFSCLHNWDTSFGSYYPELRSVARYYRESVRVLDSSGMIVQSAVQEQEDRSRRLLYATCWKAIDSLDEQLCSVEASLTAALEIFEILFPSFHAAPVKNESISVEDPPGRVDLSSDIGDVDGIEWEDGGVESDIKAAPNYESFATTLSAAGLMSVDYSLDITIGVSVSDIQTKDNEILVHQLREVTTVFRKHTVPKLTHLEALFQHTMDNMSAQNIEEDSQGALKIALPFKLEKVVSAKRRVIDFLNDKADEFFKE